jgi:rhomboid protease GluP
MSQSSRPIHPLERPQPQPEPAPQPSPVVVMQPKPVQPILTYALLAINVIVFALDYLLGHRLIMLGAKNNTLIMNGQYWLFFTPIFLHAGLIHLGVNSYSLYILGPSIERPFGHARFLILYLLSGVAGTIASFALTPESSIGASGAIFGLAGGLMPFLFRNRQVFGEERSRRGMYQVLVVIILNLVIGFAVQGIDNWGHVGGLLGGLAASWFMAPVYEVHRSPDGGQVTIEDTMPPQQPWIAAVALGWLLAAIALGLIMLRRG